MRYRPEGRRSGNGADMNFEQEAEVFTRKASLFLGPGIWLQLGLKVLGAERGKAESGPSTGGV